MSESFDAPFSSSESSCLVSDVLKPLTIRKKVEELQSRASDKSYDPSNRDIDPKMGLDTFSGLFVYACSAFIPTHLIRKKECRPDYPDGWYRIDGKRITVAHGPELDQFFLDGTPRKRDNGDDLTDVGVKLYTAIVQKLHPVPADRWLAALGMLLAYDEGPGRGGKCFSQGQEIDRDEIERKAAALTVQYDGRDCPRDFVASVLEIYATKVCKAIVAKPQRPCPHCGGMKPENKVCPHCGIEGGAWTCPSCRTKTAVGDIPNYGSSSMYCPGDGCGIPVVGAADLLARFQEASALPLAKGKARLEALQLECVALGVSWTKLDRRLSQLAAAQSALDGIATAIRAKDAGRAEQLIGEARRSFPDLDYTAFERDVVGLQVAAANAAIQAALDAGNISGAEIEFESVRSLDGFDAGKWRRKIQKAKDEKAQKEQVEAKKREFDAAWGNQEWEKAKRIGRELAGLGEKTESYWEGEVERHKQTLKQDLGNARDNALAAFSEALGRDDVARARAELGKAKAAQASLHTQFGALATVPKMAEAERKLAELEKKLTVEGLQAVRELIAKGSADGTPEVTVRWKAAGEGTPAAKWRVLRRKKGGEPKGEPLGDIRVPEYKDRGGRLKVGVEYEYGVVPLAEVEGSGGQKVLKPNDKAVVWSAPAVCKAKLAADALSGRGEGEAGQWGLATLSWRLPAGLDAREGNVKLKLMRSDGRFRDKDVTGRSGFEDDAVEVGRSYEYTLEFSIAGEASGRSATRVVVEKQPPPEAVRNLRARQLPGGRSFSGGSTWLATWAWPAREDRVLLVQSEGALANPERPALASDAQVVEKGDYEKRQGAEVFVRRGMRRLTAYSFKEMAGGRRKYSAGTWTGVTTETAELAVEIVAHRGGLFRRGADTEVFVSSSTGELPALVVAVGNGRRPQRMADGRKVAESPAGPAGGGGKVRIAVPGDVPPETIRVFLADPEGDAERFRLAPARIRG